MTYIVYVLESRTFHRHYVGSTHDINSRMKAHNRGAVRATKSGIPWKIVYTEPYQNQHEAYRREMQIKRWKGGNAFKKLLRQLPEQVPEKRVGTELGV